LASSFSASTLLLSAVPWWSRKFEIFVAIENLNAVDHRERQVHPRLTNARGFPLVHILDINLGSFSEVMTTIISGNVHMPLVTRTLKRRDVF
jgi:hypothetical protein